MLIWEPRWMKNDSNGAWWLLLGGLLFIGAFLLRAWMRGVLIP